MIASKVVSGTAAVAVLAAMAMGSPVLRAKPISYTLPDETAAFAPGPNLEAAQLNCTACHSADYIKTQPRGAKSKSDFWRAEVTKMINAYGAPIASGDVDKIVDYLSQTY
jgi:sulfite dehydrogenase (cytochrome) subunit B